jgi:hypothetical protein
VLEGQAVVDHIQGDQLKLAKDDSGKHHLIPLSWVTTVGRQGPHQQAG